MKRILFLLTLALTFSPIAKAQMNMAEVAAYIQNFSSRITTAEADIVVLESQKLAPVVVTTGTYTVLAANSGKIHMIPDLAGTTTIALPVEAAGLKYEFWYVGAATEAHNHTIDSGADINFFIGGVSFLDLDAGDAADEVHAGVYSNGSGHSKFAINIPAAGTRVSLVCDGTNWYITGIVISATVPAFAAQ